MKSLSYAPNMLAGRIARERGANEALLVTPEGRVLEAPTFYSLEDDFLCTPPLEDHILASITRAVVMRAVDVQERSLRSDQLPAIREAFLASTTREIQPVASLDGRALGKPGPLTTRAIAAFRAAVRTQLESSPKSQTDVTG